MTNQATTEIHYQQLHPVRNGTRTHIRKDAEKEAIFKKILMSRGGVTLKEKSIVGVRALTREKGAIPVSCIVIQKCKVGKALKSVNVMSVLIF